MDFISSEEKDFNIRYARHFALPEVGPTGQNKLRSAKVLLVGVGGLGGPVALYLAAAGVGTIGIIDDDKVALSNLQRQILFSTQNISQDKASTARERLLELNPHIQVEAIKERLNKKNVDGLVSRFDFIIDGSDNFPTRYLVNDACVRVKKPLIFGAVHRFDGQVSVFALPNGPCYRCVYPQAPEDEAVPNCTEAGVLGVLPGVIGSLMATEVIKLILGIGDSLSGHILIYDALSAQFKKMKVFARKDCEKCGDFPKENVETDEVSSQEFSISATTLFQILSSSQPPLVLDVRSECEFELGHLEGALNIPLFQLANNFEKIPTVPLVTVCRSGKRSQRAAEILLSQGRRNIRHLSGGLDAYDALLD